MAGAAPADATAPPAEAPQPAPESWLTDQARDPRLDGLRGIAVLYVMLYHLTFHQNARNVVDHGVSTFLSFGWSGVDLFFVLSGFLITSILYEHRASARYFRSFYARRFLRIFPLYYAVLAFFLIVMPRLTTQAEAFWIPGGDQQTAWYWLYLSNIHASFTGRFHHHFLDITWTLAIEEQFYLLWPLVVRLVPVRALVRACGAIVVLALVLRAVSVDLGANPVFLWTFTPLRFDTLALGALLALLWREPAERERLVRLGRVVAPLCLALLAGFALAVRLIPEFRWGIDASLSAGDAFAYTRHPLMQTLGFTLLALLYGGLLVAALGAAPRSVAARLLESRLLRHFGKYSYALYLLHKFAAEIARNVYDPNRHLDQPFLIGQAIFWVIGIALSLVIAWITWTVLEAPLLALKRYFPYEEPRVDNAMHSTPRNTSAAPNGTSSTPGPGSPA
jgi:peptidoglycan/LPS O-acetylase OafA/YrhL